MPYLWRLATPGERPYRPVEAAILDMDMSPLRASASIIEHSRAAIMKRLTDRQVAIAWHAAEGLILVEIPIATAWLMVTPHPPWEVLLVGLLGGLAGWIRSTQTVPNHPELPTPKR